MTRKAGEINKPDSKVYSGKGNDYKPEKGKKIKKRKKSLSTGNKTLNILWRIAVLLVASNLERKAQIIRREF